MQKRIKQWYDRHKQRIIVGLVIAALIILCFGVIIRGIYTLKSSPSTSDSTHVDKISFSLINPADTAGFRGQVKSDDKLYREREEQMSTASEDKDLDISFGAILTKKEASARGTLPETTQYTENVSREHYPSSSPGTSSVHTEERKRIKQALDEIYGNGGEGNNSDNNVKNNTPRGKEVTPQRPPTPEELLAQKKKLMEEGFDKQNFIVASQESQSNITISSPEEIPAFIHGAQTVKNNNRLALRLDVSIMLSNGQIIPRNTIIFGSINISNNRVLINVESIKYRTMNYLLQMTGFAEDGMPGLPIESEQNQRVIEDASSSAVASVLDRTISTATGGLVNSVARDVSNISRTRKESYISFIDNRRVYLRPSTKN